MLDNAFLGRPSKPTNTELATALGPANTLWVRLVADLAEDSNVNVQEWKSTSKKYGRSLRLKLKQRTIVYLSPHCGCFTASFVLGDKALAAARVAGLPASVIKDIAEAKRYPEGTGLRLEVKAAKDLVIVKKLAQIKLES